MNAILTSALALLFRLSPMDAQNLIFGSLSGDSPARRWALRFAW